MFIAWMSLTQPDLSIGRIYGMGTNSPMMIRRCAHRPLSSPEAGLWGCHSSISATVCGWCAGGCCLCCCLAPPLGEPPVDHARGPPAASHGR